MDNTDKVSMSGSIGDQLKSTDSASDLEVTFSGRDQELFITVPFF